MVDYGFGGPKTLPRNGRIRVENAGTALHFAIAFPLRPDVSNRQVGRALRGTNEQALGRVVAGEPVDVQGLISPGSTNDNEVSFPAVGATRWCASSASTTGSACTGSTACAEVYAAASSAAGASCSGSGRPASLRDTTREIPSPPMLTP